MWTHIDTASSDGTRLDLYERGGLHMIRVDGWELMNGEFHQSEDRLGQLAGLLPGVTRPEILVGGLGLGYTLQSLLEILARMERDGGVIVAEQSPAVIGWFARHVSPAFAARLPDRVTIVESDVADHLGGRSHWDVIVLDVDNGPEALSRPGNGSLYDAAGLARCRDSLTPSGHMLLWSGFEDPAFERRAETAGLSVSRQAVRFPGRPDVAHVIYVLSREPLPAAARIRLGLER